jgi:hypothetical protein
MQLLYTSIHVFALAFGLGFAPCLLGASLLYRKKFKDIALEWKKTQLVAFTILAFILNLTLLILSCFFFAATVGRVGKPNELDELPIEVLYQLGLDCLLMFGGISLTYLAVQYFFTQFITQKGIVFGTLSWRSGIDNQLVEWCQIRDYFIKADYPVTFFHFVVQQPDSTYVRRSIKVPFYVLPQFQELLEERLNSHFAEKSATATKSSRRSSAIQ